MRLNESVKDLKNERFSVRPEPDPREALRFKVRPFNREAPRPREPARDLDSEICSTKPEADPSESVKTLAKPLV
ncbi:hypothetical protein E6H15_01325 [Candidatus Bathyarchaeota archaeon]|nr:MAG: hypothetical protein E6H22_02990 [Candidatus Bathyarchaeota archaeon]TMI56318.1 MAG: hypothetical protein E6H15_01325 [Candidatus Bathyarchaeota archaeon]